jgi:XRE family transcriptional regulator, aerobic/anaerobic benzoate catabolism transcriptional regulator
MAGLTNPIGKSNQSLMAQPADTKRSGEPEGEAYLALVGERVRVARTARGMTRKALSAASGVSERYLADLETGTGNASLLVLRQIARAADISVETLIADQPDTAGLPDNDAPGQSRGYTALTTLLQRLSPADLAEARRLIEHRFAPVPKTAPQRIALVGLRGAGKTTLGAALATELGVPFIELDREIERASGMELAEIFATHGPATFRQLEYKCLETTIATYPRAVIATGGSLVTEPATFDLLLTSCTTIWLRAAPGMHMSRVVAQGDLRPMADNPRAMEDLAAILAARAPLYAKARFALDTTGLTPDAAVTKLLALVRGGT